MESIPGNGSAARSPPAPCRHWRPLRNQSWQRWAPEALHIRKDETPANGIPIQNSICSCVFNLPSRAFANTCVSRQFRTLRVPVSRDGMLRRGNLQEHSMARHVLLNNVEHKNLRVITRRGAQYGRQLRQRGGPSDRVNQRAAARISDLLPQGTGRATTTCRWPCWVLPKTRISFSKIPGWNARYLPAVLARGPFLIGFQEAQIDGEVRKSPVIHIDLDHPRVSEAEGEPLFLKLGGNAPYLQEMTCRARPDSSRRRAGQGHVRRVHGAGPDRPDPRSRSNWTPTSSTT